MKVKKSGGGLFGLFGWLFYYAYKEFNLYFNTNRNNIKV